MDDLTRELIRRLPPLTAQSGLARPLTATEYYHAAIGRHPRAQIPSHDVVMVLEGGGTLDPSHWQEALAAVAAVNPGTRLRLQGQRQQARWISDAPPPELRVLENHVWDGRSSDGLEAFMTPALDLEAGRSTEVIVLPESGNDQRMKLLFRTSHAVMDGVGCLHFMQEVFRFLRGEPLLGSNAGYTDTQLMTAFPQPQSRPVNIRPAHLLGGVQGEETGGRWLRFSLPGPQPNLLPRLLAAIAGFARQHTQHTVRIAVPVNLRRHVRDLQTTTNFTAMSYVDLPADADLDIEHMKDRLKQLRDRYSEMTYRPYMDAIRYVPFGWIDRWLSVNDRNYRQEQIFETVMLSLLGSFKKNLFSGGGFTADTLYVLPQLENVFFMVAGLQGNYEITLGARKVFASNGRLEALRDDLEKRLGAR